VPIVRSHGTVVRASMAHHQGMTLVSMVNVLLRDRMVDRFHDDPRVKATELLLQERIPRLIPVTQPRPLEATRVATPVAADNGRRFRSAATEFPHAAFLSNGNYVTVVTNAGGGSSRYRGRSITRDRRDATRDPGGQFIYLRDARTGAVWSATAQPFGKEPQDYLVTMAPDRITFHRVDDGRAPNLDIAVSTEDDVEVRRVSITNHGSRLREIDVTSYAEIALVPQPRICRIPPRQAVIETEISPVSVILCWRRPGGHDADEVWAVHVLSVDGRPYGALECETDRARFLGRGRGPDDPQALDGRPLSNTAGATLDPILSLRQRVRLSPGGFARLSFVTGVAADRETALALAHKYREPSASGRTFALAATHGLSLLQHLGISSDAAVVYERLASRVLYVDGSLRASADVRAQNTLGREALWAHAISGDLPILLVRVGEEDALPLIRQSLEAQEYWRLKGLSADIVILNEHPASYRDETHEQIMKLLDDGPWRGWKDRPSGVYLLRGDHMSDAERTLLASVARAILHGNRGTLSNQIDRPRPGRETVESPDRRYSYPASGSTSDYPAPPFGDAALTLTNGLAGSRQTVDYVTSRSGSGDAAAVDQRHREPQMRTIVSVGIVVHVGVQQPREPADAVCE
jgi:cyclic beta-1,2-glucan synthetase